MLSEHPEMPATVIAERVGWPGRSRGSGTTSASCGLTIGGLIRPIVWPGRPVTPRSVICGSRRSGSRWRTVEALLPVLVIVAAHSGFITRRMLPTRKTPGSAARVRGADPAVRSGAAAIDLGQRARYRPRRSPRRRGRLVRGMLATKIVQLRPYDPESKGIVARRNGSFETSFMPGRRFASPAAFNAQFEEWLQVANAGWSARSRPARLTWSRLTGPGCWRCHRSRCSSGGENGSGSGGPTTCASMPATTPSTRA